MKRKLTSRPTELLLSVSRGVGRRLGLQIEDQVRRGIRAGQMAPGSVLPSTRDLAAQLGVSRPVVVEAYAQLAAEGYLTLRPGALPRVAASAIPKRTPPVAPATPSRRFRFDFRPGLPDLSAFPRAAWLRATRRAMDRMPRRALGYEAPHGCEELRRALAEYLGRVRGVVADPEQIVVTSGFAQARVLICRAARFVGTRVLALENPSYTERSAVTDTGLELVGVPIDREGIRVDLLAESAAGGVIVTPAHQFPTGVVLGAGRRAKLLDWLREGNRFALEDDYDAEYRYDRAPVGALQGLDPEHVVYAGTASKTLAPALRLGWLVVPWRLLPVVRREQLSIDQGCSRIDQHTLAEFISGGDFDRHLRRMRTLYRARRDIVVESLRRELPNARVTGIAAGLHAVVELSVRARNGAILEALLAEGVGVEPMTSHWLGRPRGPLTLLLGYGNSSEKALNEGIRRIGQVVGSMERRGRAGS
jgi:GntR family transcriptional regulator / MocR family aminotransferase